MPASLLDSVNELIAPELLSTSARRLGVSEGVAGAGLKASFASILAGLMATAGNPLAMEPAFDIVNDPRRPTTGLATGFSPTSSARSALPLATSSAARPVSAGAAARRCLAWRRRSCSGCCGGRSPPPGSTRFHCHGSSLGSATRSSMPRRPVWCLWPVAGYACPRSRARAKGWRLAGQGHPNSGTRWPGSCWSQASCSSPEGPGGRRASVPYGSHPGLRAAPNPDRLGRTVRCPGRAAGNLLLGPGTPGHGRGPRRHLPRVPPGRLSR